MTLPAPRPIKQPVLFWTVFGLIVLIAAASLAFLVVYS